ncbi:DNA pilot protein [Antarctic microvirus COCH21_V_SP_16]|nr:DNA pilot protein [Antarctic microvirus COCH21_V_SP_16]
MPIGITGATVIAAGIGAATQGANAYATGRMNKKNRAFARESWEIQQAQNLHDWNKANEYNSPRAQMQRFQEAGLNKNLIYGQTHDAAPIRSSSPAEWKGQAAQFDPNAAGNMVGQYYDLKQKSAQTDMVAVQMRNIKAETDLKEAQRLATLAGVDTSKFNLQFKQKMESTSASLLEHQAQLTGANIDKTNAATTFTTDQNKRAEKITTQTIMESNQRIATMTLERSKTALEKTNIQANLKLLQNTDTLQKLEINLREKGINPNDPAWQRKVGQMLDKPIETFTEWLKSWF